MFNYDVVINLIKSKYGSIPNYCKINKINKTTFYKHLATALTTLEVYKLKADLNIEDCNVCAIFFKLKV